MLLIQIIQFNFAKSTLILTLICRCCD